MIDIDYENRGMFSFMIALWFAYDPNDHPGPECSCFKTAEPKEEFRTALFK